MYHVREAEPLITHNTLHHRVTRVDIQSTIFSPFYNIFNDVDEISDEKKCGFSLVWKEKTTP